MTEVDRDQVILDLVSSFESGNREAFFEIFDHYRCLSYDDCVKNNHNHMLVRRLIENGFDINHQSRHKGLTPLLFAVKDRYLALVDWLLNNGADINQKDHDGNTAILYFSEELSEEWNYSDIYTRIPKPDGMTYLDVEASITAKILQRNPDLTSKNGDGLTLKDQLLKGVFDHKVQDVINAYLEQRAMDAIINVDNHSIEEHDI